MLPSVQLQPCSHYLAFGVLAVKVAEKQSGEYYQDISGLSLVLDFSFNLLHIRIIGRLSWIVIG